MRDLFDRRAFVGAAGALAVIGADGLNKVFAASAQRSFQVKIALPGGTHVFNSATGKDLGNYVGPNFVQRNIIVRDRSIPFTVFFRPDVGSDRVEIVFEWGDPFNRSPANLEAYTAEILGDGQTIAKIDVPEHYWLSRWRWQSEPRPFVKTPEDLFAAKVFPRVKRLTDRKSLPPVAADYSVMGFSNITVYMPTTGERGDIGIVPEYYAAYLGTGEDSMKKSMLAWAESAASFPWHMRDAKTWAPVNWNTYPKSNTYYDQSMSSPQLSLSVKGPHAVRYKSNDVAIDLAHEPALAFLPFMLTGDLYYLEELQFMAAYLLNHSPSWPGMFDHDQTRGWAWSLRTLADVVYATPDKVPACLLPRAYWKKFLDRNLNDILANHVHAKDVKNAVFASGTDNKRMPFWQEDYLASVLGVVVYRGFKEWRPVFEWKIRSDIARTNGTSGWPRTKPTDYYPKPGAATVSAGRNAGNGTVTLKEFDFSTPAGEWTVKFHDATTFTVLRPGGAVDGQGKVGSTYSRNAMQIAVTAGSAPFAPGDSFTISVRMAKSWGELAAANGFAETADGDISRDLSRAYPQTVRAALVMGVLNGVAAAAPCLKWLEPQVLSPLYAPEWRWSFTT